ncbi:MAG: tetratricopeptide repeat protein [Prevotella sp.]|nr:tetratricopeptide repeat protein [Prevotella sp.]
MTTSRRHRHPLYAKTHYLITQLVFAVGLQAQTQRELRDSLSMIEGLITEHPKAVRLYMRKAALHIDLGEWGKALDSYDAALAIMPYNLTALYYRGYVNHHLKRYAFARQDYERVLAIEPTHRHALMGMIYTNPDDNHLTDAFDQANRFVEVCPDVSEPYAVRSEVETRLQMIPAATDDIEKAIAIEKPQAEKKYPFSDDDEIVSYQLSAFSLYLRQDKLRPARESLDYLVRNGISQASLADYYAKLKR